MSFLGQEKVPNLIAIGWFLFACDNAIGWKRQLSVLHDDGKISDNKFPELTFSYRTLAINIHKTLSKTSYNFLFQAFLQN